MPKPDYDTTLARIVGNLMSGYVEVDGTRRAEAVTRAVAQARAIIEEIKRTEPQEPKPSLGNHRLEHD